jgi:hypothetical protein
MGVSNEAQNVIPLKFLRKIKYRLWIKCCTAFGQIITYYSGGQNKVGQCFFANVNLLALSMVTMKIFIYLL